MLTEYQIKGILRFILNPGDRKHYEVAAKLKVHSSSVFRIKLLSLKARNNTDHPDNGKWGGSDKNVRPMPTGQKLIIGTFKIGQFEISEIIQNGKRRFRCIRRRKPPKPPSDKLLSVRQIVEIKRHLADPGSKSQTDIGQMYGVSAMTISRIKNGVTAKKVQVPDLIHVPKKKKMDTVHLSARQVKNIIKILKTGEVLQKDLARTYGVNYAMIHRIYRRWVVNDGEDNPGKSVFIPKKRRRFSYQERVRIKAELISADPDGRRAIGKKYRIATGYMTSIINGKVWKSDYKKHVLKFEKPQRNHLSKEEKYYIKKLLGKPGTKIKADIASMFGVSIAVVDKIAVSEFGPAPKYKSISKIIEKVGRKEAMRILNRVKMLLANPIGPTQNTISQIFGLDITVISEINHSKYTFPK